VKAFFCRLIPPRPTFALDMSPAEASLMQDHAVYWREYIAKGHVVMAGVVGDPAGPYGIGVVEFEDDGAVRTFTENDPVIRSGRGFRWEVYPMPFGMMRP
jgi:hypothetical protein